MTSPTDQIYSAGEAMAENGDHSQHPWKIILISTQKHSKASWKREAQDVSMSEWLRRQTRNLLGQPAQVQILLLTFLHIRLKINFQVASLDPEKMIILCINSNPGSWLCVGVRGNSIFGLGGWSDKGHPFSFGGNGTMVLDSWALGWVFLMKGECFRVYLWIVIVEEILFLIVRVVFQPRTHYQSAGLPQSRISPFLQHQKSSPSSVSYSSLEKNSQSEEISDYQPNQTMAPENPDQYSASPTASAPNDSHQSTNTWNKTSHSYCKPPPRCVQPNLSQPLADTQTYSERGSYTHTISFDISFQGSTY